MKKEWKCNACSMPCTLILNVLDDEPGSCPFNDTRFKEWACGKPEPLPPTHSDIMTLWWLMPTGRQYWQTESYNLDSGYYIGARWQPASWFTNRESAVIPPEAK